MPRWLKFVAQIVPFLMVLLSIFMAVETWEFQSGSTATTAEIVSVRFEQGSRTGSDGFSETTITYYPTLRFLDATGTEYTAESSQPASGFVPEVGQVIPVRYFDTNPAWVRPAFSLWTLWAGPLIFAGFGLVFLVGLRIVFGLIDRADSRGKTVVRY